MHKNTYLLVSILAVVAALLIGVNVGRQARTPQTVQLPLTPIPTAAASLTIKQYNNLFCKLSFDYPASFTFLESASGSAAFTNTNGDDGIILTCQKEIPRPIETKENTEDIQIGSVSAKLYHGQQEKDGSVIDSLIFRHPGTKLDVFLAGSGEVFQNLLKTLTIF